MKSVKSVKSVVEKTQLRRGSALRIDHRHASSVRASAAVAVLCCLTLAWACDSERRKPPQMMRLWSPSPPMPHTVPGSRPATTPQAPSSEPSLAALPLEPARQQELIRALQGQPDSRARRHFEVGFRLAFTSDRSRRDHARAVRELRTALRFSPRFAEAYRGLGYAYLMLSFAENRPLAIQYYLKAIELKPSLGEAHYGLAVLYAMTDPQKGLAHFRKAMALGVADEHGLGKRVYRRD